MGGTERVDAAEWPQVLLSSRLSGGPGPHRLPPGEENARGGPLRFSCDGLKVANRASLLGAPGLTTRNKKLLGARGIATSNKDATNRAMILCPWRFISVSHDVSSLDLWTSEDLAARTSPPQSVHNHSQLRNRCLECKWNSSSNI